MEQNKGVGNEFSYHFTNLSHFGAIFARVHNTAFAIQSSAEGG